MMTWKVSLLRGLSEVGSAGGRFCFFDIAEIERRWNGKGMQVARSMAREELGATFRDHRSIFVAALRSRQAGKILRCELYFLAGAVALPMFSAFCLITWRSSAFAITTPTSTERSH